MPVRQETNARFLIQVSIKSQNERKSKWKLLWAEKSAKWRSRYEPFGEQKTSVGFCPGYPSINIFVLWLFSMGIVGWIGRSQFVPIFDIRPYFRGISPYIALINRPWNSHWKEVVAKPLFALCLHGPFCARCAAAVQRCTLPACTCRALIKWWREEPWPAAGPEDVAAGEPGENWKFSRGCNDKYLSCLQHSKGFFRLDLEKGATLSDTSHRRPESTLWFISRQVSRCANAGVANWRSLQGFPTCWKGGFAGNSFEQLRTTGCFVLDLSLFLVQAFCQVGGSNMFIYAKFAKVWYHQSPLNTYGGFQEYGHSNTRQYCTIKQFCTIGCFCTSDLNLTQNDRSTSKWCGLSLALETVRHHFDCVSLSHSV